MDGVAALRVVSLADTDLLALVPDDAGRSRIIAGTAPQGTRPPFVMLESISKVDLNVPTPGATRFVTERVQATVVAENYVQQKAILRALRHAAADRLGVTVPGISGVSIHTDSAGPDFYDEAYSGWVGSQDFKVKFTETR